MTNIANIWKCVWITNLRNMLKAGNGFKGIPCQKLAIPLKWLFDERLESWVRTAEIANKNLLEVINHGQILKHGEVQIANSAHK